MKIVVFRMPKMFKMDIPSWTFGFARNAKIRPGRVSESSA